MSSAFLHRQISHGGCPPLQKSDRGSCTERDSRETKRDIDETMANHAR
jgi:hypothetical protein